MIFHALTSVLVILKVLNVIDVTWWLVLAPSLVTISMAVILLLLVIGTRR